MGRKISDATLQWWAKQDEHIRQEALGDENRISIIQFCKKLNKWLVGCDKICSQGPQFDMVILEHLYEQFGPRIGHTGKFAIVELYLILCLMIHVRIYPASRLIIIVLLQTLMYKQ